MKICGSLALVIALATTTLAACDSKAPSPTTEAPGTSSATPGDAPARIPHTINTGEAVDGDATLVFPPQVVAGAAFEVDWTGPGNAADYIDIVPRGYTQTTGEITYVYIRSAEIVGTLSAPATPGEYDVRYLAELKTGRVVKTVVPLTVIPATAAFEAPPAAATSGEPLSIKWTGPNHKGDYVDIVPRAYTQTSGEITYAYTEAGSPSQIKAPGAPGEYDIRYIMEGRPERQIMATAPLVVTSPPASLTAPPTAQKGASIPVTWTGPDRQGDYVDLVPKGFTNTSGELDYFYTTAGSPGSLKAPDKAGEYEVRYVLEAPGGRRVLAIAPLKVQ